MVGQRAGRRGSGVGGRGMGAGKLGQGVSAGNVPPPRVRVPVHVDLVSRILLASLGGYDWIRSDPREMRILQLAPSYPSAVGRAPPALSMGSAPRFRAPHRVDARGPLASRLPLAKAGGESTTE